METIKGLINASGTITGKIMQGGVSAPEQLIFLNRRGFPDVGRGDRLYIAKDENAAYRYDEGNSEYVLLNDFYYSRAETDAMLESLGQSSFSGDYNDLLNKPVIPAVENNLESSAEDSALSANQGRILKESVDNTENSLKSETAVNRTSVGMQCRNQLENTNAGKTVNGVTFTVNDDKSVTVNGTASGDAVFSINDAVKLSSGPKFRLTGCPAGGSDSGYFLSLGNNKDYGEGIVFAGSSDALVCSITVKSGCSVNNITFYPMICYSEITDTAYEKYSPSLNTIVQSKQNSVRVWITDGYSLNIGSRNLIEILGMALVGVKHRHYVKLLRSGNEVFVMAEDKGGSNYGVDYEYTINNNVLTITNKGCYGHWLLILY